MATTSSRKRTTKSAKSSRSTKATSKTTSKTAAASVQPAAKSGTALSPVERIRSVHTSMALVYLVFAGIVLGFVNTLATAVILNIQTRDLFVPGENVVLGPAYEVLFNVEPAHVLVASLLVSSLMSILIVTRLRKAYEASLVRSISGWRWVALGLSGALLLEYVGLLAGVQDVATLKVSGALVIVASLFSWFAERDNAGAARPKWLAYDLALVSGALAWLPIVGSLIGTTVYGMERFGWHVYAIAAAVLAGFTGFAINQYLYLRASGVKRDYTLVESAYLRIDLFTKFAVVLITILALK